MVSRVNIKKDLTLHLKELHLPTIRAIHEPRAIKAQKESISYGQYLLELVREECDARRHRRIERLLRESRLPLDKTIQTFEFKQLPSRVTQQVRSLLDGTFLDRRENLLAFGNPGSGKTHLLSAIAQELIREQGRRVYSSTCQKLVEELLVAKQDLRLDRVIRKLAKFDAILIDDIGYVQQSREEMEVLFTLLAERYERGSLLITSNLPFSKWESIFKDPMTTAAAIDRLVHHSVILELNIPSFRMKAAKEKGTTNRKGGKPTKDK